MDIGRIEFAPRFAPCTGCRNPGECTTYQQCSHFVESSMGLLERVRTFGAVRVGAARPEQGWECPRCHTIHAPFVPRCGCKP